MKDYYQILGIDKSASDNEIKRAYRKLAGKHHPDRGGDSDRFKEVQEAYDVLSNTQLKAQYDNPMFQRMNTNRNFDDILNQYFNKFGNRPAMDARITMWIDLADVVNAPKKIITVNTNRGTIPIEVSIPLGVHDNENIRYPGLAPGNSDLVINFRVHGHPLWQRDGLDLLCVKDLDFWQLIAGDTVLIQDLAGNSYNLKVPPLTKPNSVLRLSSKGIRRPGHNNGDILVKVNAVMPKHISNEMLDLIQSYVTHK